MKKAIKILKKKLKNYNPKIKEECGVFGIFDNIIFESNDFLISTENGPYGGGPDDLFFFEIYDNTIRDYRQFYSLMYEVGYEYSIPVLFEMMIEGKISLLLRERIVAETNQSYSPSYYSYGIMPSFSNNYGYVNKVKYDYFFLTYSHIV